MAKVKATLEGFEKTMKALADAPEVVRLHASAAVALSTFAVAQRARALVPVGTGKLKASIATSKLTGRSLSGRVGVDSPDTYYWYFVEFGTKNRPATPFFRPAAELEHQAFIERLRDIGKKVERDMASGSGGLR